MKKITVFRFTKKLMSIFCFFIICSISVKAQQNNFIEVLDENTALSELAEQRYNKIKGETIVDKTWKINLNPIEEYVNGSKLTINLPDEENSYLFSAYYVKSNDDNSEYY